MNRTRIAVLLTVSICCLLTLAGCKDPEKERMLVEATDAKIELAKAQVALDKAEAKMKVIKEEREFFKSALKKVNFDLETAKKARERLEGENLNRSETVKTTYSEKLKEAYSELAELKKARDNLEQDVVMVREQLKQSEASVSQLKEKLAEKTRDTVVITRLRALVAHLESQLEEKNKAAVEATTQAEPTVSDETESVLTAEDTSLTATGEESVETEKITEPEPAEEAVEAKETNSPEPAVETEKITDQGPAEELTIELGNGVKVEFVLITPSEFDMGSSTYEKDRDPDEGPVHKVRISRPFYMAKSEVTREQFAAFVQATGYVTDAEKRGWSYGGDGKQREKVKGLSWQKAGFDQEGSHPVVCVSWSDAKAFCDGLSQGLKEGTRFRLPTEAEWEYACRAGTSTPFSVGRDDEMLYTCGNYADSSAKLPSADTIHDDDFKFTAPVQSLTPNSLGLYDMHGNVWEWCSDWYSSDYYSKSPAVDPIGPAKGNDRVLRGGCWFSAAKYCRTANRSYSGPNDASATGGFRIVFEF